MPIRQGNPGESFPQTLEGFSHVVPKCYNDDRISFRLSRLPTERNMSQAWMT